MRQFWGFGKWVFVFLTALLVGYYLGLVTVPKWLQSDKPRTELETECLAAAIVADATLRGESIPVRRAVGEATVRHAETPRKLDICDVFENGDTLTAPGYRRLITYAGRSRGYVQREVGEAGWKAAMEMARDILAKPLPQGCATVYVRHNWVRWSDVGLGQSPLAVSRIRSTMKLVKNELGGHVEFYCP